ncbi:YchJ family protein [Undibacterium sp.]|jgi:SEC-C motif-containing protein|uniref:YchJ family protein n=1 Tax=Undibacterium sp. TaxID=1914977 RepID=UPI002BC3F44C|nr:YchJ family metal-binding protein [Undibacterium sp.]HTD04375.1 YchJ family metal-binding protein [Undibacterium sp.]
MKAAMQSVMPNACPCGAAKYADCCGRFIAGGMLPATAEQLMRSRYSAYALGNEAYLRATWHAGTCPPDAIVQDDAAKWLGLEVKKHQQQGDAATVEFVARYKVDGRAHRLHEVSRFVREDGQWLYVDGTFPEKSK